MEHPPNPNIHSLPSPTGATGAGTAGSTPHHSTHPANSPNRASLDGFHKPPHHPPADPNAHVHFPSLKSSGSGSGGGSQRGSFGKDGEPRRSSISDKDVDHLARFSVLNRQASNKTMDPPAPVERTSNVSLNSAALDSRRRESVRKLEAMSHNQSLRAAISTAFKGFTMNIAVDTDPISKLQQVLIHAKESGMSLERIFSFFSQAEHVTDISQEEFSHGLLSLNSETFSLTQEDINQLVQKFDLNKDGKISVEEFMNFTLAIPHVAFKAERSRRRSTMNSNDGQGLVHAGSASALRRDTKDLHVEPLSSPPSAEAACHHSELTNAEASPSTQIEMKYVGENSKLLWRLRETIFVKYFYSSKLSVIAALVFNQTKHEDYPTLYVDCNKVVIDHKAVDLAVADKVAKTKFGATPQEGWRGVLSDLGLGCCPGIHDLQIPAEELEPIVSQARLDFILNYLTQRLSVFDPEATTSPSNAEAHPEQTIAPETGTADNTKPQPSIRLAVFKKQTGDTWETMGIPKPDCLQAPSSGDANKRRTSYDDFVKSSSELKRMSGDVTRHSAVATRLSHDAVTSIEVNTLPGGDVIPETIPEGGSG